MISQLKFFVPNDVIWLKLSSCFKISSKGTQVYRFFKWVPVFFFFIQLYYTWMDFLLKPLYVEIASKMQMYQSEWRFHLMRNSVNACFHGKSVFVHPSVCVKSDACSFSVCTQTLYMKPQVHTTCCKGWWLCVLSPVGSNVTTNIRSLSDTLPFKSLRSLSLGLFFAIQTVDIHWIAWNGTKNGTEQSDEKKRLPI